MQAKITLQPDNAPITLHAFTDHTVCSAEKKLLNFKRASRCPLMYAMRHALCAMRYRVPY